MGGQYLDHSGSPEVTTSDIQRYIIASSNVTFLNSSDADKVDLFWLNRLIRNTQEYYEKYERQ